MWGRLTWQFVFLPLTPMTGHYGLSSPFEMVQVDHEGAMNIELFMFDGNRTDAGLLCRDRRLPLSKAVQEEEDAAIEDDIAEVERRGKEIRAKYGREESSEDEW